MLLEHKNIKIDIIDVDGESALTAAAVNGHVKCVALLLAHGADENEINKDGVKTSVVTVYIYIYIVV